jgi:hypothetical protein
MTKADFLKEQARLEERRCMIHPLLNANSCSEGRGSEVEGVYEKDRLVVWVFVDEFSVPSSLALIVFCPFFIL